MGRAVPPPPGPRGLPWLGNRVAFERNPLDFLLRQRGGGDLVRFSARSCLVNSPALVEEVFKRTNSVYAIGTDLLGQKADGGGGSVELLKWMRARSIAGRGLNRSSLDALGDRIAGTALRHARNWHARTTIEMVPAMEALTADLIVEHSLGPDSGPVPELVAQLQEALIPTAFGRFRWSPRNRRLHATSRPLSAEVSRLVERRCGQEERSPAVLADLLIAARDDGAIDHGTVVDVIVSTLFAAHETTAAALAWLFLLLDRHAEVRSRVLDEIDGTVGDRLPAAEDVPRLPVTEAVVKETLRLYPPLWFLEREVDQPTELGGYPLQRGQRVSLSPYVVHRDPRYYEQPHLFVPDRWLGRSATSGLPKYAFMPFGGGPRICLGAHFAKIAMAITAATVLRRYRLRRATGSTATMSTRTILQPAGLSMDVVDRW